MAKLLSIQFCPKLGDKEANLAKVEEILDGICHLNSIKASCFRNPLCNDKLNPDLVLVPEFFTTGVHHDAMINHPEDENGGDTIKFMCRLAQKYNTNIIAGSVIEKSGENLYNTSYVINRKGKIVDKYRKIHLFNYFGGTEGERITAGDEEKVVELDFAKVGLSICFDIRYPIHFRKLIKKGAEIIVCPTAWCALHNEKERMIQNWKAFNIARACESLVYIMSSNSTGGINNIITNTGNSMIVSPLGELLANALENECGIFADIDLNLVREFKKSYPVADIE